MTPSNKGKRLIGWPLTRDELKALIKATRGQRDRAAVVVMARGGLRVAELCGIDLADFRLDRDAIGLDRGGSSTTSTIWIRKPKGWDHADPKKRTQPREIGLDKLATDYVRGWLRVRGLRPGPLFRTHTGNTVHPSHYRAVIRSAARRAGLKRRVHPHALRHTFAKHAWEDEIDLILISRALGHQNLATTQIYLQSIGCHQAVAVLKKREW